MPRLAAVLALALFPVAASAAPSACPQYFLDGEAPDLTNPKLAEQTREICYSAYALLHSGVTRTPVWSAEHLTREQVEAAAKLKRQNAFHPEPSLPADQ